MALVYLNGEYLPEQEACVPVLDRGFIFGDGVYELIPSYGGVLFRLDEHLQRLENSLAAVRIPNPLQRPQWAEVINTVMDQHGPRDQSVYLQVTRGVAKRDHAIPADIQPTVFVMANLMQPYSQGQLDNGVEVVTCEDNRWINCHIKAISLLANVLLRQYAVDQDAVEAILLRDGLVTEGAASNVFMVKDDVMVTPPKGPKLLPGITRDLLLELASENGLQYAERDITEQELLNADEVWLTSSLKEVLAVTKINGKPVGQGKPGPMWRKMHAIFQDFKRNLRAGSA